jgi:hypothetical protein
MKRLIAFCLSGLALFLSFMALYYFVSIQVAFGEIFPANTNCSVIKNDYGENLKSAAYADWKFVF